MYLVYYSSQYSSFLPHVLSIFSMLDLNEIIEKLDKKTLRQKPQSKSRCDIIVCIIFLTSEVEHIQALELLTYLFPY